MKTALGISLSSCDTKSVWLMSNYNFFFNVSSLRLKVVRAGDCVCVRARVRVCVCHNEKKVQDVCLGMTIDTSNSS